MGSALITEAAPYSYTSLFLSYGNMLKQPTCFSLYIWRRPVIVCSSKSQDFPFILLGSELTTFISSPIL